MERELVLKTKTKDNVIETVLLENGEICEYRKEERNLVGNIYAAKVTDCVEGIGTAFCDIGLEESVFLKEGKVNMGSMVMVQVVSAKHYDKGVAVSTNISISGIYVVLMAGRRNLRNDVRVSNKIADEKIKHSLKHLGMRILEDEEDLGIRLIMRTDSSNASDEDIENEANALIREYKSLLKALNESGGNPRLLRESDDLATEMIRRYPISTYKNIYTDDPKLTYSLLKRYSKLNVRTLGVGNNGFDIFDILNISSRLVQLLGRKVWLESGAYILIEPTEAMTVIDVNSGKFKGNAKKGKEDAIFAINMEAAGEVMRQLRLRNIGGIIVCDFIDMQKDENGELLLEYMRNLAKNDFEQPSVIDITKLGLVEITRKRS